MTATTPEPKSSAKTILLVDDHPVLRRGLSSLIESEPDLVVCGEAETCPAALEAIRRSPPDLVIVDLELAGSSGLDLSMHDEAVYAERSLRAGARGYLTKQQLDETVLVAMRRLLAGETYMSAALEARLAEKFVAGGTLDTDSPLEALSDRELEVFRLIGRGWTTRQIAADLHLSPKTIESHREHIKQKLGIESAAQLGQPAAQWVESGRTG